MGDDQLPSGAEQPGQVSCATSRVGDEGKPEDAENLIVGSSFPGGDVGGEGMHSPQVGRIGQAALQRLDQRSGQIDTVHLSVGPGAFGGGECR